METKFSELLEIERKKRDLNKAEMAILLGMSERMYGYYQSGKYDGQPSRIEKYLKILSESKDNGDGKQNLKSLESSNNQLHEGKALQFYLKLDYGSISKFAKQMGYTTNVYMYELFEMQDIPDITWAKFEDKADIKKQEVIEKYANFKKLNSSSPSKSSSVPVYDIDFTAGDVTQFSDFPERVIGHIDLNGFKKCIAFVKVRGNSMFPTFTAGDLVGLEPQDDISIIEYGQPFAIVTKSGQSLIKIIRKGNSSDDLILRSNNKDFDDIDIHKKDILRLYKAHGPVRDSHY